MSKAHTVRSCRIQALDSTGSDLGVKLGRIEKELRAAMDVAVAANDALKKAEDSLAKQNEE